MAVGGLLYVTAPAPLHADDAYCYYNYDPASGTGQYEQGACINAACDLNQHQWCNGGSWTACVDSCHGNEQ